MPIRDGEAASLGATVIFNDVTQHRKLQRELEYASEDVAALNAFTNSTFGCLHSGVAVVDHNLEV